MGRRRAYHAPPAKRKALVTGWSGHAAAAAAAASCRDRTGQPAEAGAIPVYFRRRQLPGAGGGRTGISPCASPSSAPATSASSPGLPGRSRQRRALRRRRRRQDRRGSNAGEIPIYEPGPRGDGQGATTPRAGCDFTTDAAAGVAHGERAVHRRRHAARRGRLAPTCSTCWPSARTIGRAHGRAARSSSTSRPCRSAPPTGCARAIAEELAARGASIALRRGLEPGVPQGRRGGRGLHAARPHRDRHRRRATPRRCCASCTRRSTATTSA